MYRLAGRVWNFAVSSSSKIMVQKVHKTNKEYVQITHAKPRLRERLHNLKMWGQ